MKKRRIDELLVEKGLAVSIDEARRFIMAGLAVANDKRIDKAGDLVPFDAVVRLKDRLPYVSRGGLKLKHAVDTFKLNMQNAFVMDIGSSTGGFTDVCLQEGAECVVAVDSGTAQLHNKLLHNEKVIDFAKEYNFSFIDITKSCITGAKGNIEYLSYFVYKGIHENNNIENIIEKVTL